MAIQVSIKFIGFFIGRTYDNMLRVRTKNITFKIVQESMRYGKCVSRNNRIHINDV